jgi:hypothetical protein
MFINVAGLKLLVVPGRRFKSVGTKACQVSIHFIKKVADYWMVGKDLPHPGNQLWLDLFENNIIGWHSIASFLCSCHKDSIFLVTAAVKKGGPHAETNTR